jgi:hypothetical protein
VSVIGKSSNECDPIIDNGDRLYLPYCAQAKEPEQEWPSSLHGKSTRSQHKADWK